MRLILVVIPDTCHGCKTLIPFVKSIDVNEKNFQYQTLTPNIGINWLQKGFLDDEKLHYSVIGPYAIFTDYQQALTFFINKLKEREYYYQHQIDFFHNCRTEYESLLAKTQEEK